MDWVFSFIVCFSLCLGFAQQVTGQGSSLADILPAASGGKTGVAARSVNGRQYANTRIVGQVLVLDVASLHFATSAASEAATVAAATLGPDVFIKSAQECSLFCALVPGCNSYSYCTNPAGCGTGCPEYVALNPRVNATGDVTGSGDSYWVKLPIQGFGPFAPVGRSGCQADSATGAWPYGMCTLFTVAQPVRPEALATGPQATGWVSGTFLLPAVCKGMSARGCESCTGAADLVGCLACVNETQQDPASAAIRGSPLLRQPQDGCRACYSSRSPLSCMECIRNTSLPCNRCTMEAGATGGPVDIDGCITCVNTHGEQLATSCISCSQSIRPQECMTCLNDAAPNVCGVNKTKYFREATASNNTACIPVSSNVCKLCVERSTQKEQCLACTRADTYSADCEYCALEADPAAAADCYACSSALFGTKRPICADCLHLPNPSDRQKCLACLTSPGITDAGKQFCLGCATWYGTNTPLQNKCFDCLQRPLGDAKAYRVTCSQLKHEGESADGMTVQAGSSSSAPTTAADNIANTVSNQAG